MNDTNLSKNMMRTVFNTAISKAEYRCYFHRNALNVVLGKLNQKKACKLHRTVPIQPCLSDEG